ncbi:DNRLRE domain-containing protein [Microbulbifer halophilus]|uniref:DNRLRE domain-containing protein n=1 Tax=Microbulbifer halophilus TaxID=453963 RepID=A0ABW5EC49_9GAMM|nr:DNRLRE domain-containing protein [Microbulbifer halophilus]MCW8125745.1 DNRLRE domain-containing protein [Microbulbifer halophilus]
MRQFLGGMLFASACLVAADISAATKHHRLSWDGDGSNSAVIGFSPDGSSNNPTVKYGYSTDEGSWSSAQVDNTETFDGSITSHFVRLSNLNADSEIYFRVCDQDGCGQRFWFRTAPADSDPYVVVAGGDTRTGHTNRRQGNRLLAKVRPLAVMHGGDFTNANSAWEMDAFLDDWTLTYSSDQIDGYDYKRIYPLIPTHGNHEDGNYSTLCQVFGVDFNDDGNCNPHDTYGAVQVSPLLRIYTLNSQFKDSGWSSYAQAMNNWLQSDLSASGSAADWRLAQYHKPMFPHYTGKSENETLFGWWAQSFYDYAVNLVVESDTHMTKLTQSLIPDGNDFAATTSGGTVYTGEGSWGAPARSANDPKSWTIDLASIQQFKVIQVRPDQLVVRTAQFDSSAATLSRAERDADPLLLPAGVNWWSANQVGEAVTITRNSANRSVIDGGSGNGDPDIALAATDDVFVSSSQSATNLDSHSDGLLADGSDSTFGEMMTLIRFDLSELAGCSINGASLELNITNVSGDNYGIYRAAGNWREGSATWDSVGGSGILGGLATSFTPSSTGIAAIHLQSPGLLDDWLDGANTGLVIASRGGSNGVDMTSKETGLSPVIRVDADCDGSGGGQQLSRVSSDDVFVSSYRSGDNFDGHSDGLLADGWDFIYGELYTLVKFDLSDLACSSYSNATLELDITNRSDKSYGIYLANSDWQEESATWNSISGADMLGPRAATFVPSSTGTRQIDLQSSGLIDSWLAGGNTGLVIAPESGSDGVDISSRETGQGPLLKLESHCN